MSVNLPRPMPPGKVPFTDPKTGKITREWLDYFLAIDAWVRAATPQI